MPRLQLIHLMALTAATAVALVPISYQQEAMERLDSDAARTVGDQALAMAINAFLWGIVSGGCLFIVGALLAWRRKGYRFRIEPGHWLAIEITYSWCVTAIMFATTRALDESSTVISTMSWGSQILGSIGFFLWFLYLARKTTEPAAWRWCYAVLALATPAAMVLGVALGFANAFRSRHPTEVFAFIFIPLTAASCLQAIVLLVAIASDRRHGRRRHWTHTLGASLRILVMASATISYAWMMSRML